MSSKKTCRDKVWNENFIRVFIANICLNVGQQIVNTLVAKYADVLGATATVVGMIASAFAFTALFFKIFAGPSIDIFNKKYIAAGALLLMAVAFCGFGISNTIPQLFVFRLIQGAGQAFSATCCLALASETIPVDSFGTGIGYFSLGAAVCQAIAPTIALKLSSLCGYHCTFFIAASFLLLGALVCLTIQSNDQKTKKFKITISNIFAMEAFVPALLLFFLSIAYININSFLIIYAGKQGVESNIGLFFTVYAITMLFTRPFLGKMTDRYGYVVTLLPAMICFAVAFAIISIADTLPLFLLAAFISAFGFGACQPAIQTLCMKCVPKDRRGAGSTMSYIGNDLGNLVGPVLAGWIVEQKGYSIMWRFMMIPILIAMLILLCNGSKINQIDKAFKADVNTQ